MWKTHPYRTMSSSSTKDTTSSSNGLSYWDSHGDYEADERRHLQLLQKRPQGSATSGTPPSLYRHQSTLPTLPIPSLQDTIDRFLPTALPLCESEEERAQLIMRASSWVRQAEYLQTRLQARAAANPHSSWLQLWWNHAGYLQPRTPNAIQISYFFRQAEPVPISWTHRAAQVLRETVFLATPILQGTYPPDMLGRRQIPLCSSQYKYLFQACRIPRTGQDVYRVYYFNDNNDDNDNNSQEHPLPVHPQQYAVVAYEDQFYKVPLVNPKTRQVYSVPALEKALHDIISLTQQQWQQPIAQQVPPALGWLTAMDRNAWAQEYTNLQQSSRPMAQALETLQGGLCLVNLDEITTSSELHNPAHMAQQLWHGNGRHTGNRWWDKSLQFVVAGNAQESVLGCIGEHAMADGMPVSTGIWKHLLEGNENAAKEERQLVSNDLPKVENIFEHAWMELSDVQKDRISEGVSRAQTNVSKTINESELYVLEFKDYDAQDIAQAGFSVDAFGQLAMQLASIKAFGKKVATYESTQTRTFLHGRTETTRSVSPEAAAFCRAMLDKNNEGNKANNLTFLLLEAALQSHVTYSRNAAQAMGVDRHFMGLAMSMEEAEELPDLFSDPVFVRSKKWRLSTSTLPGTVPGFGPVEPDGIGVGYDLQNDCLHFTITGWKDGNDFAQKMHASLGWALSEMETFLKMQKIDKHHPKQSKL